LILSFLCLPEAANCTPRKPKGRVAEPFRSLDLLDKKLSLLNTEQQSLQASGTKEEGKEGEGGQHRKQILRSMEKTTTSIENISLNLQRRYAKQHKNFGTTAFRALHGKAHAVQQQIRRVEKAASEESYRQGTEELNRRVVALVVQFQAISGSHAALRCASREWACCEPKQGKDLMPDEQKGCRWMCVQRKAKCTGLLGPRGLVSP
jgi:hypothetical protein